MRNTLSTRTESELPSYSLTVTTLRGRATKGVTHSETGPKSLQKPSKQREGTLRDFEIFDFPLCAWTRVLKDEEV